MHTADKQQGERMPSKRWKTASERISYSRGTDVTHRDKGLQISSLTQLLHEVHMRGVLIDCVQLRYVVRRAETAENVYFRPDLLGCGQRQTRNEPGKKSGEFISTPSLT